LASDEPSLIIDTSMLPEGEYEVCICGQGFGVAVCSSFSITYDADAVEETILDGGDDSDDTDDDEDDDDDGVVVVPGINYAPFFYTTLIDLEISVHETASYAMYGFMDRNKGDTLTVKMEVKGGLPNFMIKLDAGNNVGL